METAIDIYTKLVIALLSFTTPIIIQVLSVFSEGIEITKRKTAEQKDQVQTLLTAQFTAGKIIDEKTLNDYQKTLKKLNKVNRRTLFLINPKWQSVTIFGSLLFSLTCIVGFWYFKDIKYDTLAHVCAWTSLIFFLGSMVFMKLVAWAIVDTKHLLTMEKLSKRSNVTKARKPSDPSTLNNNETNSQLK